MKKSAAILLPVVLLTISYMIPHGFSENHTQSYQLLDKPDGSSYYKLNVTVQQSLYEYYTEKSHKMSSNNDLAKFVTPYALKPIAESLWGIYTDDEDFVNGALIIVHQIPYEVTQPAKYPVETIVANMGDCDLFSYVAASIIKAGGLDVVLLYYEDKSHMNIGVSLSHAPYDSRSHAFYVTYNDVKYYVAECTGGDWKNGWRIGECPEDLKQTSVQVITLENCEQWAPGQVSASYRTLLPSAISLSLSTTYLIQGSTITLWGELSPTLQNEVITVYMKVNNSPWMVLCTVSTDTGGKLTYTWNADSAGVCFVRASWSGNDNYAGADSPIQTVTTLSMFFVLLLITTVILVCVGLFVFFITRQSQKGIQEPQPPEMPS